MVSRPARGRRCRAAETERRQVQRLDKGFDHLNWIVLIHPILEAFGQKGTLRAVDAFNETTHPILPHLNGKTLPDSRVSTQPGSEAEVGVRQEFFRFWPYSELSRDLSAAILWYVMVVPKSPP